MPTKEERFFIYLLIFGGACGIADAELSLVEKLQYGVVAVASIKLLNRFLKWFEEWIIFLAAVVLSNVFLWYVFSEYWGYYFAISIIYTIFIFVMTYNTMRSHNKKYAKIQHDSRILPEYRTRTFSQQFSGWSKELNREYK